MAMIQKLTKQRSLCRRNARLQARGFKAMVFQDARVKNTEWLRHTGTRQGRLRLFEYTGAMGNRWKHFWNQGRQSDT